MNHMRTIGSRKISGASDSDAYASQRTTVPEPLRLQQAMSGDYLRGRAVRTPLRRLGTGFGVSAA
jgi:hypothetical protein